MLSLLPPTLAEYQPPFFAGHEGAARLREELYREHPGWDNMVTSIGWERILISSVEGAEYARYQGENFVRAAQMHGCGDPADLMAELIARAGGKGGIIVLSMAWEDVQAVARLPYTALISDALYGGGGNPHPRLYGAFPRMLRKLVREEGVLSFEQAVYKMTAMPAQRAHLSGRGVLRPGAAADLLVFRPEDFTDTATYASPKHCAAGLRRAYVSGQLALRDGEMCKTRAGRVLRRDNKKG